MQLVMLVSVVLSTIVGTYVGVRLLRLAQKTRQGPEFLVGASLVSYAAVAQVGLLIFLAVGTEAAIATRMTLAIVRVAAYAFTLIGLATFTWQVFGKSSAWRRALVVAIGGMAFVGAALTVQGLWVQLHGGPESPAGKRVVMNIGFTVTYVWMATEALRYHRLMRRRMALGLADAVLTNRFFLWGAGAGASALLVAVLFGLVVTGNGVTSGNPLASMLISVTGLLNTAVWALTFTPPQSYCRWVRGRSVRAHG